MLNYLSLVFRRNLNVSIMEIDERLHAQSNIYSQTPPTNFASLNTVTVTGLQKIIIILCCFSEAFK